MTVLCACEESQAVCKEFRRLGHEAYSCDILECSGGHPEWHIQGDVLEIVPERDGNAVQLIEFKTMDGELHEIHGTWDMIIAFPPCTYLSNAGACRLYPKKGQLDIERYHKGLQAKDFFMRFLNADCEKICVENPVSSKVFEMPPHSQEVQPWMFGHPVTKKTRLWLRGLPLLKPTDIVKPESTYLPSKTSRKDRTAYGTAKRGDDARERAKTFSGLAKAMAEQFGGDIRDD